jgi:phage tail sheath gpL-like
MATNFTLAVQTNANYVTKKLLPNGKGGNSENIDAIESFFMKASAGAFSSNIFVSTGLTYATGTITFSSFAAADTITINGTVMTGRAAPTLATEFKIGATDTLTAAAAAAAINANTTLDGQVFATSSGAVLTLTCVVAGLLGNLCTIAISAHGSVSGGGKLASGADGTSGFISHGL